MIWLLAPFLTTLPIAMGTEGIVADGAYWKQTISFRSSGDGVARLQVVSRGRVRVRGERGSSRVSGTLTKRVKAPSAAQAKLQLDRIAVMVQSQGGVVMVDVSGPEPGATELVLELTAPRPMKQTAIQTRWGDVDAAELDGSVFVESGGGTVRLDAIGLDAVARTAGGEMRLGRIGGSMNCATGGGTIRVDTIGGSADFSTGGGEIWIREVKGDLRASTAGGNIHIERAGGEVTANSGGGLIEVAQAASAVVATTTGGSIEVGGGRNVQCESGSGSVRLKGATGSVNAAAANGMILAEIAAGAGFRQSSLTSVDGDIIVFLPSNLAVTVRARTEPGGGSAAGPNGAMSGRIHSEFPEIQGRYDRWRSAAAGRLNGGGPVLELTATGGSIHLRRLKP